MNLLICLTKEFGMNNKSSGKQSTENEGKDLVPPMLAKGIGDVLAINDTSN